MAGSGSMYERKYYCKSITYVDEGTVGAADGVYNPPEDVAPLVEPEDKQAGESEPEWVDDPPGVAGWTHRGLTGMGRIHLLPQLLCDRLKQARRRCLAATGRA